MPMIEYGENLYGVILYLGGVPIITKHPLPINYKSQEDSNQSTNLSRVAIVKEIAEISNHLSSLNDVNFALYVAQLTDAYITQSYRYKSKDSLVKATLFDHLKNQQQKKQ